MYIGLWHIFVYDIVIWDFTTRLSIFTFPKTPPPPPPPPEVSTPSICCIGELTNNTKIMFQSCLRLFKNYFNAGLSQRKFNLTLALLLFFLVGFVQLFSF